MSASSLRGTNDQPLVSVMIPCFNAEETLRETLGSVDQQSYPNREIILVDDGSSDGTAEIANEYRSSQKASRVTVVQHEINQGLGAARNSGLAQARGSVLAFLDADDLWHPEYLTEMVAELNRESADVYFGQIEEFNTTRDDQPVITGGIAHHPRDEKFSQRLYVRCTMIPSCVVIPRATYEKVGDFHTIRGMNSLEDHDYWMRCLERDLVFNEVAGAKCYYRRHDGSITCGTDRLEYSRRRLRHRRRQVRYRVAPFWVRYGALAMAVKHLCVAWVQSKRK